jgi:hypothetical protein
MMIENAAFGAYATECVALGVGAILIAAILVWKKLRAFDAQLGQIRADLNHLQTLESRRLIIGMNSKAESKDECNKSSTELKAGVVAGDVGASFAEGEGLALASLVPLVQIENFLPGHDKTQAPIANRDMISK